MSFEKTFPITMSDAFLAAVRARRTYYGLSKASTIPDKKLRLLVATAVKYGPSPINVQSGRAVLLLGKHNDRLWEIVKTEFLKTLGGNEDAIQLYSKKIAGYAGGYGTILFFEDTAALDKMAATRPALASSLPTWSEHSTGMLQYIVWTALTAVGMGASLQHYGGYSAELAKQVLEEWNLPSTWKSTAMMPFGVPVGEPGTPDHPKTFAPIPERVLVFE